MPKLRILHISDLHAGQESLVSWRFRRVLGKSWIDNLEVICAATPPDIVCFTGDIAQSGQAAQYDEASLFLDATLSALKLGKDKLFVVPGNHDIARSINQPQWAALREEISVSSFDVSRWMAGGHPPRHYQQSWREEVLARQQAYRDWLVCYGLERLVPGAAHPNLGYRVSLPGWPVPLNIIGFDSAWLAGDEQDKLHLRLTNDQVGCLLTENGAPLIGVKIALVHHPLSDLADQRNVRSLLGEFGVHLLMHGHVHRPDQQRWLHPNNVGMHESVAGCLYQSDNYPNCIQLIELELSPPDICVPHELWLRSWSPNGFWSDDNSHYRESTNGRLRLRPAAPTRPSHPISGRLVGRGAEMTDLRAAMLPAANESGRSDVLCCVVEGMPGVGKTRLAEQFIALHWAPHVARAECESYVRLFLQTDFTLETSDLAHHLALLLNLKSTLSSALEIVAQHLRQNRILLLIENVDSIKLAHGVAGLIAGLPSCPVLVTARLLGCGMSAGWQRIQVGVFSPSDALTLLREEAPNCQSNDAQLAELAKTLGYLPLALHIAASHLEMGSSPDLFLHRLRDQTSFALNPSDPFDPTLRPDRARAILHSSFAISWEVWREQCATDLARTEALASLAHGPSVDCGASLGAGLAGLHAPEAVFAYEHMCLDAQSLSLLTIDTKTKRAKFHPLLGEWLRNLYPALQNLTEERHGEWLLARLSEKINLTLDGLPWNELHEERAALIEWLGRCKPAAGLPLRAEFVTYALRHGPFAAWQGFAARMLTATCLSDEDRSDWYGKFGLMSYRAGDLALALEVANTKIEFDLEREWLHGIAVALGLKADILQARGELDEALLIYRELLIPHYEKATDSRARAIIFGKIADIHQSRSEFDEAMRILREEELPTYEKLGDLRERAVAYGKIADILQARGDIDAALCIRYKEEIPVFDRIGDLRERTVTIGKIADVLFLRCELDEALRIRREEQLPAFEKLGDLREIAITIGKIADIYTVRGEYDEALRIHRFDELPVYERLGDTRQRAIAVSKIVQILQIQGEFSEALRLCRKEVLPVFEKLGALHLYAHAIGLIAGILQARGEFDEALRMLREEVLPIYEKLGDVLARAEAMGDIASILINRGEFDEALRIHQNEVLPVYDKHVNSLLYAKTYGKIANILQSRGELDEALRIRRQVEIPIYEKFGDIRLRAKAIGKVADVLQLQGEVNEALRIHRYEELPVYEKIGADHSRAVTVGKIAGILTLRGELDEALRNHREIELPIYEKLKDENSRAGTLGRVADILQVRGDLTEALRIRRDEQLPVYTKLGDERGRVTALARIAYILLSLGEFDEALRIFREEVVPVYEALGDIAGRAIAIGHVADILEMRGEIEEALRIRREEVLPVYELLGDVRLRANAIDKIADILQIRGELEEALRIRLEDVIPVYKKLGDRRAHAYSMGKVADILHMRGNLADALRIRREEELPVYEELKDVRSWAIAVGKIADIFQTSGELREAQRIRQEEELPIYEKLGDTRAILVTQVKIAQFLMHSAGRSNNERARELLEVALLAARRMRLPEVALIENLLMTVSDRLKPS
ncbi:MAG: metallophosphoesterase [Pseudomonadota bacterium]